MIKLLSIDPSQQLGGKGFFLRTLKDGLEEKGIKAEVFAIDNYSKGFLYLFTQIPAGLLNRLKVGLGNFWVGILKGFLVFFKTVYHLRRNDVCHCQDVFSALPIIWYRNLLNHTIRIILTVHSMGATWQELSNNGFIAKGSVEQKTLRKLDAYVYQQVDRLVTVSEAAKSKLLLDMQMNLSIDVIYNGISDHTHKSPNSLAVVSNCVRS